MILFIVCTAFGLSNWSNSVDNFESSVTQLKHSIHKLQIELHVQQNENIPVLSILSKAKSIGFQIENLQKQINQMDKQSK
jgi:hypothetical protein